MDQCRLILGANRLRVFLTSQADRTKFHRLRASNKKVNSACASAISLMFKVELLTETRAPVFVSTEEDFGDAINLFVEPFYVANRFRKGKTDDLVGAQRGHISPLTLQHHLISLDAKACGEHAIKG